MKQKILIIGLCVGLVCSMILSAVNVYTDVYAGGEGDEAEVEEELDDEVGDETGEDEDETRPELPKLYIKAVNPGYKINGVNNVGEMIEIARWGNSDAPISLAGATVGYTNSSGNYSLLSEFPENSWMTGESILLRLASSPGAELANLSYKKTLAMSAGLTLMIGDEVIDEVCWTGKEGCYKAFTSAKPMTLVRNLETGEFEHVSSYTPEYREGNYYVEVEVVEEGKGAAVSQCKGLQFSEILSYYESTKAEQFIEFYNAGSGTVILDGCKVRYKNKKYILSGVVGPEGYVVYYPVGFSLTKNPTNSNKLELIDTDEAVLDVLEYPNGQRKGTSYAWLGYDEGGNELWRVTYAPTPGAPNNYQEFKTCEAGKVINKVTGNCVKVTSAQEKICKEGYYLNILTGRCKKKTVTTEKTCKEGYYLNPETGRCKKIVENKGANYGVEPENYDEESSFVALYAVLGVLGIGAVYLVYEFRGEIVKLWRKVWRRSR